MTADLFGGDTGRDVPEPGHDTEAGAPLAARMRPSSLEEFVGQQHLLAPGRALRQLIERDEIGSIVLWEIGRAHV